MTTALDIIVDIDIKPSAGSPPVRRADFIAFYCVAINTVTIPESRYVEVNSLGTTGTTDDSEALYWTTDSWAQYLFTGKPSKVYLVFYDADHPDGSSIDFVNLTNLAYTLLEGQDVDTEELEFTDWDGLFCYYSATYDSTDIRMKQEKFAVWLGDEGGHVAAASVYTNQNSITNMQYRAFPGFSKAPTSSVGQTTSAIDQGYSLIYFDDTTVTTPSLFSYRYGDRTVVDAYVPEYLKYKVQYAIYSYIVDNTPSYTNSGIIGITQVGREVLQSLIDEERLESGTFIIPLVAEQGAVNKRESIIKNAQIKAVYSGAIWRIEASSSFTDI